MRTLATLLLTAALAAPPALAQVAAGAGGAGVGNASPLLTVEEVAGHVERLASDDLAGRRAGTPGAERAALYVVRQFQAAGLVAPAQHPTYLQTFEFPVGVELGSDNRLVLQRGSRLAKIFSPGVDFMPLAGSVSDRVILPVVFVGYGISAPGIGYDDYAGVDVEGKVVLALRFSPEGDDPGTRFGRYLTERHKAAVARERGARAILFVNPPATEELDRLIPFDVDERPRTAGIPAISVTQGVARQIALEGGEDLSLLQHRIDTTGQPQSRPIRNAVLNLRVDVRPRTRTTHNVIGIVPGRDPVLAREAVVIGAHYDGLGLGGPGSLDPVPGEIHNGADDNASGVAAVLELAEYFAYPTNRAERTLVFVAFGAEEVGMLGSARFVADPTVPLPSVAAMLNLDMVGRLRDELIVYGVGSSDDWPAILADANAHLDLTLRAEAEGFGPSDHAAFYLRQVPVLSFFTGVHEDYHRSTDDFGSVNTEGIHAVARLVREIVNRVGNGRARPAFHPSDAPPRDLAGEADLLPPAARGGRLGAVPVPAGPGAGGVVVEIVLEGSPAAAAGLEPGDRIVAVGGREVADVYAYREALNGLVPDRAVSIVVERDGRRVDLSAVPAAP
ncbi:MAG TPA: M20/M25/M40 family metallo-hydrolase [Gemmatimonadota bacterium]|nr:M20/M25/M40 family metallo-hydrolase [Gemmatimonadota bacterium]